MTPRKPTQQRAQPSDDDKSVWFLNIRLLIKPVALAIATSAASILAYVLTPLNELVNSALWSESAEIYLIPSHQSLQEGDVLSVGLFVQPQSVVPLSAGILEVGYTAETLRPGAETTSLLVTATKKLDSSTRLVDGPLEFVATSPGRAEITATLRTKTGKFSKVLSLSILPSSEQKYPTHRNFGGAWNIDLGGIHGQMQLTDLARTITGHYSLSDGNRGLIEGSRDGKTFRVTFYRGSAPSRIFVEANFDPNPIADLELNGKSKLLVPTGDESNPWRENRQLDFYAVARAR
jgi:hypothetical protein